MPLLYLICVVSVLAAPATAARETAPEGIVHTEAGVTLNLRDTDIQSLIATVADLTDRNFVVDPRVKGRVTIYSAAPTDADELYQVFLSILKVHGFAAIESGDVVKIVPDAMARQASTKTTLGGGDELTTAVITLEHANAPELVPILRPLLPQEAHLGAVVGANVLVVADSAANIRRLVDIARRVDRPQPHDIEVIELEHALADRVAQALADAQGAERTTLVIADPRTNRILLGGIESERSLLRRLVRELDQPGQGEADRVDVVFLRYAEATEMVELLQAVGDRVSRERDGESTTGQRGATTSDAPFLVHADPNTNALIVQGAPDVLRVARQVIEKLDVRRAQVLVEGIVAEVSTTRLNELGIQWKTNAPDDGLFAGANLPGFSSGGITDPFVDGATPALLNGFTFGYFSQADLRTLVRALGNDQYSNVLSTPTLVTLDNAEAEIVVGQNVPFITGQFTNNATTPDNPFQTIERQDVGIVLRVKPQINEGDSVTLEIVQEVSTVDRDSVGADLITNKRSITTSVLVDDRNIVVLGGLISDDKTETRQKIPLLGDIPVLGRLFRNDQSETIKQNLMVFLRPTIIRDEATNRELVRGRYEYIRERQVRHNEKLDTPLQGDGPLLDPFENAAPD